ncbi:hypothetical protein WS62_19800 [Burkholderia sp. ABCPW 14]|uniref:hypothetical protein n=1 Tax=Burkholderia sp. ABCPW 14 TaxID=1637860 RepID=UPI000770DE47|nr:hypothetical protein [Burkholderia sp. ABCPW 14]KVD85179.1 hypothetical protein WS62_19800 [Burkholderia sp. ABCPW 14]
MKIVIILIFFAGLSMLIFSGVWGESSPRMLYFGFLVVLAAYLLLLIFLYGKKVNVYARGGVIKFSEKPWGYRFYFFLLFLFWLVPSIGLVEKLTR